MPRHVDIEASASTFTDVVWVSIISTGIERSFVRSVKRLQHDSITVIEDCLCAITLMNVPIKDQHFLSLLHSQLSHQYNIVEEAET